MQWHECAAAPMRWFQLRDALLFVVHTPALLLTLLGFGVAVVGRVLRLPRLWSMVAAVLFPLLASLMYSPSATALLSTWLRQQIPSPSPALAASPVVVLVGRGPAIAEATTQVAASQFQLRGAKAVYVSGDLRSTAQRLLDLGLPPGRVFGDSCARTTWENAKLTNDWLRKNHPDAPVLLITDPWQLPRATRALLHVGLNVTPLPVEPPLPSRERNRLALRETAATLLYSLQGRL